MLSIINSIIKMIKDNVCCMMIVTIVFGWLLLTSWLLLGYNESWYFPLSDQVGEDWLVSFCLFVG